MKLVITGRNFSSSGTEALDMLRSAPLEVVDYSDRGFGSAATEEQVAEAVGDAEILLLGPEPCRELVLERCPNLKMISRRGIGFDNIDLDACRRRGVTVLRTLGAVEAAVAEQVMAYILYFARRIDLQDAEMQQGRWQRTMMSGAKGRTLGLVGFGGIGREVAKRAAPFGMTVLCHCRHMKGEWEREYGVRCCELEELLSRSDYVALCLPLTAETTGMVDEAFLAKMKVGSRLINIARGGIVVDEALRAAVLGGHLAGAAVDVFRREPCTDSILVGVPGIVLTPHTAPYTSENFHCINEMAARNVLDYLAGRVDETKRLV